MVVRDGYVASRVRAATHVGYRLSVHTADCGGNLRRAAAKVSAHNGWGGVLLGRASVCVCVCGVGMCVCARVCLWGRWVVLLTGLCCGGDGALTTVRSVFRFAPHQLAARWPQVAETNGQRSWWFDHHTWWQLLNNAR